MLEPSEAAMEVLRLVVIGLVSFTLLAVGVAMGYRAEEPNNRERFDKLFAQGNFKDAYEGYRGLALDPKAAADRVGADLVRAVECLVKLGRIDEIDAFREAVVAALPTNWRLLQAAAESYLNDAQHFGFIVADKFHRGWHQGAARYVGAYERDRSRALQLLFQGLDRRGQTPIAARWAVSSCAQPRLDGRPGGKQLLATSGPHAPRRTG